MQYEDVCTVAVGQYAMRPSTLGASKNRESANPFTQVMPQMIAIPAMARYGNAQYVIRFHQLYIGCIDVKHVNA
jgi:hypothetical protein